MSKLHISPAPHIHQKGGFTTNVMLDVVIAMLPAAVAGVIIFGFGVLGVIATCVATAVVTEFLFNLVTRRRQTVGDLSAVVTGLLLALNLSTEVPLWQCAVGSVFAILVVKCLFGGLGHNIVNPAIAARVFMLLVLSATAANPTVVELTATATPLNALKNGQELPSLLDMFLGLHGGTIGETCAVALLVGFAYLVVRKVIKWYVPLSYIATVFVCYLLSGGFNVTFALQHVLAGGLLLGAIFMATDYVTTPATNSGRVVFCVGCGLLTFAIRQFSSYPEGVSIAILTMNLLTPFISDFTKRRTLGGVK